MSHNFHPRIAELQQYNDEASVSVVMSIMSYNVQNVPVIAVTRDHQVHPGSRAVTEAYKAIHRRFPGVFMQTIRAVLWESLTEQEQAQIGAWGGRIGTSCRAKSPY